VRDRDLHLIVGSVGLSALGDWLALIPLSLHVQERTGSGLAVAALFMALWAPLVAFAGPAGLIVDRFDARRVLAVVSAAQAAVAVALAFAGGLATILPLVALLGATAAISQPAEFALVPAMADERGVARANGRVEASRYLGFALGPLLGGLLAAGGGTQLALLVDAGTFAAVGVAALALRARRAAVTAADGDAPLRARDGVTELVRDRTLALVLPVFFVSLLFMTAVFSAEIFFIKDFLDAGDVGYGALTSAWMLGMAAGAIVVAPRVPARLLAPAALAGVVVQGLGLALPTLWLVLPLAFAGYAAGGVAHGMKNAVTRTLIHERVPERVHGRAFAAYNALRNGAEMVALPAGGAAVVLLDARWTMGLAGALSALVVAVALLPRRRAWGPAPEPATATA